MRWVSLVIRKVGSHCLGGAIHLHEEHWHASRLTEVPGNRLTCVHSTLEQKHGTTVERSMCAMHTHKHMQLLQRERVRETWRCSNPWLGTFKSIRLLLKVVQRENLQTFQTWQPPPKKDNSNKPMLHIYFFWSQGTKSCMLLLWEWQGIQGGDISRY